MIGESRTPIIAHVISRIVARDPAGKQSVHDIDCFWRGIHGKRCECHCDDRPSKEQLVNRYWDQFGIKATLCQHKGEFPNLCQRHACHHTDSDGVSQEKSNPGNKQPFYEQHKKGLLR